MDEMIRLDILKGEVLNETTNRELRKAVSDANLFMERPYHYNGIEKTELERELDRKEKMENFEQKLRSVQEELFSSKRNFYTKFAIHQYRLAKLQL